MQVHPRSHFAWTSYLDSFCVGEPLTSTDSCSGMQGCVLVYDDVKQISDSTYLGGFCQHFCWHLIFFKNMCNHFWKQQYLMGFCHEIYAGLHWYLNTTYFHLYMCMQFAGGRAGALQKLWKPSGLLSLFTFALRNGTQFSVNGTSLAHRHRGNTLHVEPRHLPECPGHLDLGW